MSNCQAFDFSVQRLCSWLATSTVQHVRGQDSRPARISLAFLSVLGEGSELAALSFGSFNLSRREISLKGFDSHLSPYWK